MDLSSKSGLLQNICGIEIDASALTLPAADGSFQPFANTHVLNSNAVPIYFGKASVRLQQTGKNTRAGMLWTQQLQIKFPNADPLVSKRIEEYKKAKYIYIKLSGGLVFFFGRNDYYQNTAIKCAIKTNIRSTEITYTTTSIFSLGFTNGSNEHALPEDLPINFFNL